jgi:uncharacterized membrane protein YjjP (DUF1212 family)
VKAKIFYEKEIKMKKYTLMVVAVFVLVAAMGVGKALAAGSWYDFNVTVPKLGGSISTNNKTNVYSGNAKAISQFAY